MTQFFILRHVPTGRIFPQSVGRGQTHLAFMPLHPYAPRMWSKRSYAKGFLTRWLKGPLVHKYSTEWETESKEETGLKHIPPDVPRVPEEYEIVEVMLTFKREISK